MRGALSGMGVAAIMALAACGQAEPGGKDEPTASVTAGSTPTQGSGQSSGTSPPPASPLPPPSDSPTPESSISSEEPGIRSVDFGNWRWKDPGNPSEQVTLKGGKARHHGSATYTLDDAPPEYLDVNGDGHEDAIVKLMADEGNGYQDSTTAWVWDSDSARPNQVIPAISLDERCGNVTRSVKFSKANTFSVTRLMRVDENCATKPTKEATLTIKVKGGFAWQTAPTITALDCPHVGGRGLNFPGSDFGNAGPRAWPDPAAPVMITGKNIVAMDIDDSREGVQSGWNRILFIRSDRDIGDVPPCGYFPAP